MALRARGELESKMDSRVPLASPPGVSPGEGDMLVGIKYHELQRMAKKRSMRDVRKPRQALVEYIVRHSWSDEDDSEDEELADEDDSEDEQWGGCTGSDDEESGGPSRKKEARAALPAAQGRAPPSRGGRAQAG